MSYVDKNVALKYCANSQAMFQKNKDRFLANYSNAKNKIASYVSNNDLDGLYNYICAIKNTSLNIGSSVLNDDSDMLLDKIKKGDNIISLIEMYIETLDMVILELSRL